jgi:hypothetical protein
MMCDRRGFQALSEEQSNAYSIKSADAYRRRHKLLTSKALKAIRRRLALSQAMGNGAGAERISRSTHPAANRSHLGEAQCARD